MADLIVTPKSIGKLAEMLNQLTDTAEQGTTAVTHLKSKVWVSYGVSSGVVNESFVKAEKARRAVGESLQQSCADLALRLRVAADLYESVDAQAGSAVFTSVSPPAEAPAER